MHPNCELIVAYDKNGAIGTSTSNSIPWNVPEDLAHFKQVTTETPNTVIVMGRKTFESIGSKTLPDRIHIVLTKSIAMKNSNRPEIIFAEDYNMPYLFEKFKNNRMFIIGGREIYDMFFDMCKVIHVSLIHVESGGDVLFPRTIDETLFDTTNTSEIMISAVDNTPYQFFTFTKKV
jgi:dihydrofolate reductase